MRLLKYFVLPPLLNIMIGLLGLLLWRRFPRLAFAVMATNTLLLLVLSLPVTHWWLEEGLVQYPYPTLTDASRAQAIVVLGGGRITQAIEWQGRDTVSQGALRRLAEGVRWHHQTDLPLIVTGGRVLGSEEEAEAELMARVLREVFLLEDVWQEDQSRTTADNARFTAELLRSRGMDTVLLVTHAAHQPRSVEAFAHEGIQTIPVPIGTPTDKPKGIASWIPRAERLLNSAEAIHEYLGQWVYRLERWLAND